MRGENLSTYADPAKATFAAAEVVILGDIPRRQVADAYADRPGYREGWAP